VCERARVVVETGDRFALLRSRFSEAGVRTVERRITVLVDEARKDPSERHHRVGNRAADHAAVLRPVERAQLNVGGRQAAQGVCEARDANGPVARVGEHQHVGAQLVEVRGEKRMQRR
jgi:hypothetical protein